MTSSSSSVSSDSGGNSSDGTRSTSSDEEFTTAARPQPLGDVAWRLILRCRDAQVWKLNDCVASLQRRLLYDQLADELEKVLLAAPQGTLTVGDAVQLLIENADPLLCGHRGNSGRMFGTSLVQMVRSRTDRFALDRHRNSWHAVLRLR